MNDATGSGHPLIDLEDVHLKLASAAGEVNILRGVDLRVQEGERICVVGPSGSGKSTLLMVIAGLEQASRGRVVVAGCDLANLGEDALARFRRGTVGIVFQSFHLIQTMTAVENVAVPLELAGRRDAFALAREELAAVGLAIASDIIRDSFRAGEQQRVALARAFAIGPRLLLADEPTGNLDRETGRQIIDLMLDLGARRETTLALVTHDPDLALRADRIVHLADGRIAERAPAGALWTRSAE